MDTADYFLHGYLSQGNYLTTPTLNRGTTISLPDSVNFTFANSLTPSTSCPLFETGDKSALANTFFASFQGKVADRLNAFLDGLVLNATDVGVMQDLCGFSAEVNGDTRFCDVFERELSLLLYCVARHMLKRVGPASEWLDYEYAHDLNYYYG